MTDFLASNNISAAQIHADYESRQREAQQQQQQQQQQEGYTAPSGVDEIEDGETGESVGTKVSEKKRKHAQDKALAKIKEKKGSKKRKRPKEVVSEDGDDDYDLSVGMYTNQHPLPGQLENCELCGKRFTVTPYSKTGAAGGLLCLTCAKEQEHERKKNEKGKKKIVGREKRRQVQSNLLDGVVQIGSKSLQELCIQVRMYC